MKSQSLGLGRRHQETWKQPRQLQCVDKFENLKSRLVVLKVQHHQSSLGAFRHRLPEFLIQEVWGGTKEFALLTSSQVMPMLLSQEHMQRTPSLHIYKLRFSY